MNDVPNRQKFPIWIFAVVIPVGVLSLCCVGALGIVATRWMSGAEPVAPKLSSPVAENKKQEDPAPKHLDNSPVAETKKKEVPAPKESENPPKTQQYDITDWNTLYLAYKDNEAAADAKYLNKRIQFSIHTVPAGVEKDNQGRYFAWVGMLTQVGLAKQYRHCILNFRDAEQAAGFKPGGEGVSIRGVCLGKKGMVNTFTGVSYQNWPVVAVGDCELVARKEPEEKIGGAEDRGCSSRSPCDFLEIRAALPVSLTQLLVLHCTWS